MTRRHAIPRIGITLGDVNGIGPEVAVKAVRKIHRSLRSELILIGSVSALEGQPFSTRFSDRCCVSHLPRERVAGRILFWSVSPSIEPALHPGRPAADAARAAHAWILAAAEACRSGELDAMVTAPINKAAFARAGLPGQGHTEFIAAHLGVRRYAMLLAGGGLRVALATRHIPLAAVPAALTRRQVAEQLALLHEALPWLGCAGGTVAVAGLNPHAGDGGALGSEERIVIAPVIRAARRRGWRVEGPVPGDTVFHRAREGAYGAVLAMYHDQGLAALKTVAFDSGVNITLGLPIVRTSPDHGTAYDRAGRGDASCASMVEAIRWADRLARRKNPWRGP